MANQQWTNSAGTTTLDHYKYTYDRNSNRTGRTNELKTTLSETYLYDGLDRLQDVDRGGSGYQNWSLDALGNWNSVTDDVASTTETRTANDANEIETISGGGIQPTYDAAGNMISGPRPDSPSVRQHYIYDAWNRLLLVLDDDGSGNPDPTDLIAGFGYDGRNFRIAKYWGFASFQFYYNEGQQLLEEQLGGITYEEYVWDLRYIDAPILRENYSGDVHYYTNDANFNVTALIDASTGDVVERYHYDAYGNVTYMDDGWAEHTVQQSGVGNVYLYSGRRLDPETGLMYYRARYYDVQLGRFINRDPIGYADGLNVYAYVGGNPVNAADPSGLAEEKQKQKGNFNDYDKVDSTTTFSGEPYRGVLKWTPNPGQPNKV